jgi:putative transposase
LLRGCNFRLSAASKLWYTIKHMVAHIIKEHNKSLLLYHIVCPAKRRKKVFTKEVEKTLIESCKEIEECYEIYFIEIGADVDHVHFLIQSTPMRSPTTIVRTVKSITARLILKKHPELKQTLLGSQLWTSGYYINTVSRYGGSKQIQNYIKSQGMNYKQEYQTLHKGQSQDLFENSE